MGNFSNWFLKEFGARAFLDNTCIFMHFTFTSLSHNHCRAMFCMLGGCSQDLMLLSRCLPMLRCLICFGQDDLEMKLGGGNFNGSSLKERAPEEPEFHGTWLFL